jgi:IclR family transcriptional regulator, pca regulon regulatory protein
MSAVQSVERAFAVISCLAAGTAGVSEIADRVGLPKSTVARLLDTLLDLGVVEQTSPGGGYRLGPYLYQLAGGAMPAQSLIEIVRPHLAELVGLLNESAGLSLLDGVEVLYIDQVSAPGDIQVRDWTGERLPPHVVSSGLVLLAGADSGVTAAALADPLPQLTASSIVDPSTIRSRVEQADEQGYAWVIDELSIGMSSVAAPIRDRTGKVIAALHVHGPTFRFPATGAKREVTERVVTTAERISAALISTNRDDLLARESRLLGIEPLPLGTER